MNKDIIIREAKEYINNQKTLSETARVLGISKRTLQIHFKKLETINGNLYLLVEKKKETNQQIGRIKGGTIGVATSNYTVEQVLEIAKTIIRNELTYEEASQVFCIPKSTIYELVHGDNVPKEVKDALDVVSYANRKKALVANLGKKNGK